MSNNHKYPYEAQQEINDLERKLEASRQECERLREFKEFTNMIVRRTLNHNISDYEAIMAIDEKLTTKSEGGEK